MNRCDKCGHVDRSIVRNGVHYCDYTDLNEERAGLAKFLVICGCTGILIHFVAWLFTGEWQ